jgi:hypothetical protein
VVVARCDESDEEGRRRTSALRTSQVAFDQIAACFCDSLLVNQSWDYSPLVLSQRLRSSSAPTSCYPPRSTSRCSTSSEVSCRVSRLLTLSSLYRYRTGKRVVLASASPRRSEILATFGLKPEVVPSTFPETLSHGDFEDAGQYCVATGTAKVSSSRGRSPTVEADLLRCDERRPSRCTRSWYRNPPMTLQTW